MIRAALVTLALALPTGGARAQDTQTLADIRAELSELYVQVETLRGELMATGSPTGVAGAAPLDRLNAIEAELTRLTAKTEELEFRIDRIVRDGTNRIGDLEFRLCELEEGCDIGALGPTPSLGGVDAAPSGPAAVATPETTGPALAVGERSDFDAAVAMLDEGQFREAAEAFLRHTEDYPGGPLASEAHLRRGIAFEQLGEMTSAARAYLDSFSGAPEGPFAAEALTRLGRALGAIGQAQEACVTLGEVAARFPASDQVLEAQSAMRNLGCN